jgi:Concanavalin A-like lectin/glucanases superfamily
MNYQPGGLQENLKVPESVQQVTENIGNSITNLKENVSNNFNEFSNQTSAGVGASAQFLQSNTIVAKFAFLILVIVGFLFFLNLGIVLVEYFLNPSSSPFIVKGMISGQTAKTFPQDPAKGDIKTIIKQSNNRMTGIEFTWSVWLYINDLGSDSNKYKFVFNKGDTNFGSNNITQINNAPGVYIAPSRGETAKLHIVMDTSDVKDKNNHIVIDNVPIRKWVNVIIRLENTMLDVYINGTISGRLNLPLVPKQNYNDINVCQGGGFNGNLSDLRYFDRALSIIEITNIYYWGPNLNAADSATSAYASNGSNYLSSLWYSGNMQ